MCANVDIRTDKCVSPRIHQSKGKRCACCAVFSTTSTLTTSQTPQKTPHRWVMDNEIPASSLKTTVFFWASYFSYIFVNSQQTTHETSVTRNRGAKETNMSEKESRSLYDDCVMNLVSLLTYILPAALIERSRLQLCLEICPWDTGG